MPISESRLWQSLLKRHCGTQMVPIGAALFILAQLLSTPDAVRRLIAGRSAEDEEIEEEIAKARAQQEQAWWKRC